MIKGPQSPSVAELASVLGIIKCCCRFLTKTVTVFQSGHSLWGGKNGRDFWQGGNLRTLATIKWWSLWVPETLRQNSKWKPQVMGAPSTLRRKGVCPLQDLDLQCQSPKWHSPGSSESSSLWLRQTSLSFPFLFKGLSLGLHPLSWPPRSPCSFPLPIPWKDSLYSPLFPLFFKPLSLLLSHHFRSCLET